MNKRTNKAIQDRIGEQLRIMYDDTATQGLPDRFIEQLKKLDDSVVPDKGFEPLTNGLQNRCSTSELIRLP